MKSWQHLRHRLRIYSAPMSFGWLWYATCKCGWQIQDTAHISRFGVAYWGRETWDSAFAVGVAHLREECKHAR